MRSVFKGWPMRLLATALMLALVAATVIGTYAHAAGHPQPHAEPAAGIAGDHAGHHHGAETKASAAEPGHLGGTYDGPYDGNGAEHDIFCHGGQAILASHTLLPPALHSVPVMPPAAVFAGAPSGALDRPPKAFRFA